MNKLIVKYIDNSARPIKESTKIKYKQVVKKMYLVNGLPTYKNILINIENHKEFIKKVRIGKYTEIVYDKEDDEYGQEQEIKTLSKSYKKNIISMALVLLDAFRPDLDKWEKLYEIYYAEEKRYMKDNKQELSAKEKKQITKDDKKLTIKDLKRVPGYWKRQYKKDNDIVSLFNWLISSLYVNIKVPRRNIYYSVKIIDDAEKDNGKDNYLVLSKKSYFIFNTHKSDRKLGVQYLKIPSNSVFLHILRIYLAKRQKSDYLLISPYQNKKMTSSQMTKYINKAFSVLNEGIGCVNIRKIFISDTYQNDTPLKKRGKLAKLMGHSIGAQQQFYEKK